MADSKENVHKGHRERLRNQFIAKKTLDSMPPHNVLELLLFYSIPRADTNELAHRLIDKFGSLRGVFDAQIDSLLTVDGVGERTAVLIKLVSEASRAYLEECASDIKQINSTLDAVKCIKPKFTSLKNEALVILCLNNAGRVLNCAVVCEGNISSAELDMRKIMSAIIDSGATAAVIAHNHPGGVCAPSKADRKLTCSLARLFSSIHARLLDHIIIADDSYFSFADTPQFSDCLVVPQSFNAYASDALSEFDCLDE